MIEDARELADTLYGMAITPGGRVGDASPLAKPGYKGKRKLDDYVREIAHALMRKRGMSKSHAIAVAKNATRRWARGGGKVRPQVRAGAAKSVGNQARIDAGAALANDDWSAEIELSRVDIGEILDFATGDYKLRGTRDRGAPKRYRHGWVRIDGKTKARAKRIIGAAKYKRKVTRIHV